MDFELFFDDDGNRQYKEEHFDGSADAMRGKGEDDLFLDDDHDHEVDGEGDGEAEEIVEGLIGNAWLYMEG